MRICNSSLHKAMTMAKTSDVRPGLDKTELTKGCAAMKTWDQIAESKKELKTASTNGRLANSWNLDPDQKFLQKLMQNGSLARRRFLDKAFKFAFSIIWLLRLYSSYRFWSNLSQYIYIHVLVQLSFGWTFLYDKYLHQIFSVECAKSFFFISENNLSSFL